MAGQGSVKFSGALDEIQGSIFPLSGKVESGDGVELKSIEILEAMSAHPRLIFLNVLFSIAVTLLIVD